MESRSRFVKKVAWLHYIVEFGGAKPNFGGTKDAKVLLNKTFGRLGQEVSTKGNTPPPHQNRH